MVRVASRERAGLRGVDASLAKSASGAPHAGCRASWPTLYSKGEAPNVPSQMDNFDNIKRDFPELLADLLMVVERSAYGSQTGGRLNQVNRALNSV